MLVLDGDRITSLVVVVLELDSLGLNLGGLTVLVLGAEGDETDVLGVEGGLVRFVGVLVVLAALGLGACLDPEVDIVEEVPPRLEAERAHVKADTDAVAHTEVDRRGVVGVEFGEVEAVVFVVTAVEDDRGVAGVGVGVGRHVRIIGDGRDTILASATDAEVDTDLLSPLVADLEDVEELRECAVVDTVTWDLVVARAEVQGDSSVIQLPDVIAVRELLRNTNANTTINASAYPSRWTYTSITPPPGTTASWKATNGYPTSSPAPAPATSR